MTEQGLGEKREEIRDKLVQSCFSAALTLETSRWLADRLMKILDSQRREAVEMVFERIEQASHLIPQDYTKKKDRFMSWGDFQSLKAEILESLTEES